MIILGYFFLFIQINICCGYQGTSDEYPKHMFFMEAGENYPIIINGTGQSTVSIM